LGLAYARKGEYDLAIQSFKKALQLNPGNLGISGNLETVLKKKQNGAHETH
jgi:cytochrome c-type biogenesis protein CcmH/NrfG